MIYELYGCNSENRVKIKSFYVYSDILKYLDSNQGILDAKYAVLKVFNVLEDDYILVRYRNSKNVRLLGKSETKTLISFADKFFGNFECDNIELNRSKDTIELDETEGIDIRLVEVSLTDYLSNHSDMVGVYLNFMNFLDIFVPEVQQIKYNRGTKDAGYYFWNDGESATVVIGNFR